MSGIAEAVDNKGSTPRATGWHRWSGRGLIDFNRLASVVSNFLHTDIVDGFFSCT
jgi:hypothetical protein